MTATLSAAALRMPYMASVAAPAPLALGTQAEPCAPATLPANTKQGLGFGGIIAPAFIGWMGGSDCGDRFGGMRRSGAGSAWHRQDQERLAGGGPLRE